jgi:cytochrome c5
MRALCLLAVSAVVVAHAAIGGARAQETPAQATTRSIWDGVFTDEQARRGQTFYAEYCARCHGANLQGGENRALAGDRFWTSWQETTVDRLLSHIATNMPHSEDGSLKGTLGMGVYADITAHILRTNAFPPGAVELTAASGAGVGIIRREGSGELPSDSFVHVVGCLAARDADRNWRLLRSSPPSRVLDDQGVDAGAPLGDREFTLRFVITSLDTFIGHRMSVRASLMGEGGVDGLNVTSIQSVSETCE